MSETKIKFCGLKRIEDVTAANMLGPDFVGFVFWDRSKRNVTREQASELGQALLPNIKKVGVFVDEEPERVAALVTDGIIDIAQLHGHEDEEYIAKLRSLIGDAPIIKAFVVKVEGDIKKARECSADYLLLDSGTGTGQTFNWELIEKAKLDRPYFLAGGLGIDNVAQAIDRLSPMAVDVSSGIETDGVKDLDKMRTFIKAVKG